MTAAEREMAEALKQYVIGCAADGLEPAVLFTELEVDLLRRLLAERAPRLRGGELR